MEFSAGASYQVSETMKFSVDGDYKQYQDKVLGGGDDSLFSVGAGVDFTVMDGLAAVADVRYMSNNYGKKAMTVLSASSLELTSLFLATVLSESVSRAQQTAAVL